MKNSIVTVLSLFFLFGLVHAVPPPPITPTPLRFAKMAMKVQLVEAKGGTVKKVTFLCNIQGEIPVYEGSGDNMNYQLGEIAGCEMKWKQHMIPVTVQGALMISTSNQPVVLAQAYVGVTPSDAKLACPDICGPQSLADSHAKVKASGALKILTFSLQPNPVSILRANPVVWLEAEATIVDFRQAESAVDLSGIGRDYPTIITKNFKPFAYGQ